MIKYPGIDIRKERNREEERFQKAFTTWMGYAFPEDPDTGLPKNEDDLFWFAVPNGAHTPDFEYIKNGRMQRTSLEGKKMKDMGVKAGVWDVLLFWKGPNEGAIELKSDTGKLSPNQEKFGDKWGRQGRKKAVCSNWREIEQAIKDFGLHPKVPPPRYNSGVRKQMNNHLLFEFYKPL